MGVLLFRLALLALCAVWIWVCCLAVQYLAAFILTDYWMGLFKGAQLFAAGVYMERFDRILKGYLK